MKAVERRQTVRSQPVQRDALGRVAATPLGRPTRNRLAAHGMLWTLVAARQPPTRPDESPVGLADRILAGLGFPGSVRERLVSSRSDVCIEGFPRSANSYTVAAFRSWNRGLRVAHHMHAAFQVRRAVRLGVPCCVLVRRPLDAVASTLLMDGERISDDACYLSYIRYHRRIAPLRGRVVTCRFEELVNDPSIAVERLNERFGTSFAHQPMTTEAKATVLAQIERRRRLWLGVPELVSAAPNEAKEERKQQLRERLAGNRLLADAEAAYAALVGDPRS